RGLPMRAVAVEEISGHAAVVLRERAEPAAEVNAGFSEPRPHRLVDHALQPAAMNRELRNVITGVDAARLAPDLLTETVGVEQLVGADRDSIQALEQAELGQFLDGVRQRIDADAQLADGVRLLEEFAVDPAGVQHQRRDQPADARACDDHLHDDTPRNSRLLRASLPRRAKNAMICRRDGYGARPGVTTD